MANTLTTFLDHSKLKSEFSSEEWHMIKPILEKVDLEEGEVLFEEGSKTEDLYFLEQGCLEISKKGHQLAILKNGWVGEIAALRKKRRTASVQARKKSVLIKLSLKKLQLVTKNQPNIFNKFIMQLSFNMADRLEESSEMTIASMEKKLELAQVRVAMGHFLFYLVMALGGFFFIVKVISVLDINTKVYTTIGIPLILFFCYFLHSIIKKSGYPLSFYGLTLKNWKPSVKESLLYTAALLLFLTLLKWVLINTVPAFHGRPLFILHQLSEEHLGAFNWTITTFGYALLTPLQELIARGCLQGSLAKFLMGKRKTFFSIVLSNLLFSVVHLQISLKIAIIVFFIGCFWGWLYSKEKTIIGVSLSHAIVGIWGISILGLL